MRGSVTSRTRTVNRMMAMPIWWKLITYNTIRVLSIGRIMISVQMKPKASKEPYLTPEEYGFKCACTTNATGPRTLEMGLNTSIANPHEN